jgi:hypothetical protein
MLRGAADGAGPDRYAVPPATAPGHITIERFW